MSVVYRVSDTRELKIDSVTVTLRPLDYKIKADMQASVMAGKPMDAAVMALKHCIKGIKGLKLGDGKTYELEFETDGALKENHIDDLLNIPESAKLSVIAVGLINGMPEGEFMDPETGVQMEGVKFVKRTAPRKK